MFLQPITKFAVDKKKISLCVCRTSELYGFIVCKVFYVG